MRPTFQVVVIDQGAIAEMGTHDQLLQQNGVYKRLVLRQLTAGTVNVQPPNTELSGGDHSMDQPTADLVDLGSIQSQRPGNEPIV